MDFELQRKTMVESQVRPSDVTDRRIIRAILELPRELFVPGAMRSLAYMDGAVALTPAGTGPARALMAPRVFAKLVQLAEIETEDAVLDVGAATGYSAAILSRLAGTVVALESDRRLGEEARQNLARLGIGNVTLVGGDLARGCPDEAPFDVIVLEGLVPEVPASLLSQLKDGGRLVAVLAHGPLGRAAIWRRLEGNFDVRRDFDADAPLLPGFEKAREFAF